MINKIHESVQSILWFKIYTFLPKEFRKTTMLVFLDLISKKCIMFQ